MVSKARLDLPEPDNPVTTTRLSRGISIETSLRLWTRAPWIAIVVRAEARGGGEGMVVTCASVEQHERELLHLDVALPGQLHRQRHLRDEALIGEILARRRHAADVVVAAEVVLEFGGGAHFAN